MGLLRSGLPGHPSPTGLPVFLRAAQRIEESHHSAFPGNAHPKRSGGAPSDSSDSFGILRMTVAAFLWNPQNDGGSVPSESSE